MPELILVLHDLYPARLDTEARAALPRLPALERWLARGERSMHGGDWRSDLWRRRRGAEPGPPPPPAAIAGAALPPAAGSLPLWLATPVHYVAGLDTLRLHPAGLLELDEPEQQALAGEFARVFGGSGWTLHATGRRELLLEGGAEGQVRSSDPARWLGSDPAAGLVAGEGAAPLRRLGAEIEMWLHDHAVNQRRRERGLLEANGFWIWGGGAPRQAPHTGTANDAPPGARRGAAPRVLARDLFVDGLCVLHGAQAETPPARWPAPAAVGRDQLAVCALGAVPDELSLLALDQQWLAPALDDWRRGAYDSATLLAGSQAVTLGAAPLRALWRSWRRPRPWWEALLQC